MITDEQFNQLGGIVVAHMQGCRPVEEAQIELLSAILTELRSLRKSNDKLAKQFDAVSAGGNVLLTERVST